MDSICRAIGRPLKLAAPVRNERRSWRRLAMAGRFRLGGISRRNVAALVLLLVFATAAATATWHYMGRTPAQPPHFLEVAPNAYFLPQPDAVAQFQLVRHDDAAF